MKYKNIWRSLWYCKKCLDEADSIFRKRQGGNDENTYRSVLNELLIELDGFASQKKDRILLIAATNSPNDIDDAMLRRLPNRLLIDLPDSAQRELMVKKTLMDSHTANTLSNSDFKYFNQFATICEL